MEDGGGSEADPGPVSSESSSEPVTADTRESEASSGRVLIDLQGSESFLGRVIPELGGSSGPVISDWRGSELSSGHVIPELGGSDLSSGRVISKLRGSDSSGPVVSDLRGSESSSGREISDLRGSESSSCALQASETVDTSENLPEIESISEGESGRESAADRLRRQAWMFIQGECFPEEEVRKETVSVWLRTLLDQNSRLVETLNRVKQENKRNPLRKFESLSDLGSSQTKPTKAQQRKGSQFISDVETSLERPFKHRCTEKKIQSDFHSDHYQGNQTVSLEELENLRRENQSLRQYSETLDKENQCIRDINENLRNDIDCLLKISDKARDKGIWDPHGLNFCVVTFEQVFGPSKEHQNQKTAMKEVHHEKPVLDAETKSSTDSRSSLSSELNELQTRNLNKIDSREYCQVKSLRREIVRLQEKCSARVREGVERDGIITNLQLLITEINNEMEELRVENNANLSVIDKLKDDLHEARSRLLSTCNIDLNKHASVSSLPEIPAYTSRFAKHLSRRSSQNLLIQKISDQLESVNREKGDLEEERHGLLDKLDSLETEKAILQEDLDFVKGQYESLAFEHEKLKADFRTLVRLQKAGTFQDDEPVRESDLKGLKELESLRNDAKTKSDLVKRVSEENILLKRTISEQNKILSRYSQQLHHL